MRSLAQHQGWPLWRRLLWMKYHETCISAQEAKESDKKLSLLSKSEGIRVALDLGKEILAKDEDEEENLEESS